MGPTPVAHLSTRTSRRERQASTHSHTSSSSATGTDMLGPVRREKRLFRAGARARMPPRAGSSTMAPRGGRVRMRRWVYASGVLHRCVWRWRPLRVCAAAQAFLNRDRGRRAQVVRFYGTMERAVYPLRELAGSVRAMPMPRSATYRRGVIEYACFAWPGLRGRAGLEARLLVRDSLFFRRINVVYLHRHNLDWQGLGLPAPHHARNHTPLQANEPHAGTRSPPTTTGT